ncbi:MAG: site-specific integrase [Candidatus Thermoplasmatota archaeon]|nr:site-specific integrase [Candidatus Thermoplasmatota archaeon]
MPFPVPRNVAIQSASRNLNVDFFTDEEVARILEFVHGRDETDARRSPRHKMYYLLVKVLYRTGARIDEALMLKPSDMNLVTNSIRLRTLKQKKDKDGKAKEKYRILSIHPDLRDTYMQYLLEFSIPQKGEELLFPMKRQVVDLYLKKIQASTGIRIHAHKFRHTFAVKAIMDNVPLNVLQQWLGHSSIFTTSVYTQITGMDTSQFMERIR